MLLQVVLCVRLLATGLWRPYRRFTAYMVGLTVESGILSLLTHRIWLYQRTWCVTRPILLVLQLLAVHEIFSRWAESHQNMGKFGQRLFYILMAMATVLAAATVPVARSSRGLDVAIYIVLVANQAAQFGAAAFMLLMLGFFAKFGGPVGRNLRWHSVAMTAFSLTNTIAYLLVTTGVAGFGANVALQVINVAALLCWTLALTRSGERAPRTVLNPDEAEEAEEQNRQMLEFADSIKQRQAQERR